MGWLSRQVLDSLLHLFQLVQEPGVKPREPFVQAALQVVEFHLFGQGQFPTCALTNQLQAALVASAPILVRLGSRECLLESRRGDILHGLASWRKCCWRRFAARWA